MHVRVYIRLSIPSVAARVGAGAGVVGAARHGSGTVSSCTMIRGSAISVGSGAVSPSGTTKSEFRLDVSAPFPEKGLSSFARKNREAEQT